jgi:D-alanyl-D-alanine carboxypeptidase
VRNIVALLGACLLTTAFASAAPPPRAELQRQADRLVRTSDIPAVVVLVERDGRRTIVAAGLADRARRVAARPGSRFWVGSITKSFVAVVVMQLVAEGVVGLDDRVETWLPGALRAGTRVRLRHLLNHTSGVPDYMALDPWRSAIAGDPRAVIAPERLIASAGKLSLEFEPGSQASYSNTNYLILGEIVERATRGPLARALRSRIFEPLGLHATAYEPGDARVTRPRMHGYDVRGTRPRDVTHERLGGPWADGAIVSSARDLAVFFGAVLRGKLVPPRLVRLMTTIVPGSHGEGLGLYRLGSPCGRVFFGHTGGTPGQITFAAGSRDARRFFVLSVNGVSPPAIAAMGRFLDELLCA